MLESYKTLTFLTLGEFHTVLICRDPDPFSPFLDISVLRFRDLQEWSPILLSSIKSSACRASTGLSASITLLAPPIRLWDQISVLFWGTRCVLFWVVGMFQVIRGDGNWWGPVTSEQKYITHSVKICSSLSPLAIKTAPGSLLTKNKFPQGKTENVFIIPDISLLLNTMHKTLFPWLGHFLF